MSQPDLTPTPKPTAPPRLRLAGAIVGVVAIVIVAYGLISRAAETSRLHDWTEAQSLPTVAVAPPSEATNKSGLELPGRLEAFVRAPIYARVSGYLRDWKHDIGSKVKGGDLLGEIDTPDVDQQLAQARADLAVAQANAKLAQVTAQRWQSLAGTDAVSKQDVDTRTSSYNANLAQVKAAQANVDRLVVQKGFGRLVAPFDGVVTARDTDVGALINVGSGSSNGPELFELSDVSKLRVYVNVPQNFVPSVPPGTKATLHVPERPDKSYTATVEASAQSVNANTGTTLMQLVVDNNAGELLPGGYASMRLDLADRSNVLSIPSSALIFNAQGLSVATVGADNHIVIKPVTIARDLGQTIEIGTGLSSADRVVVNPPDGVVDGTEVRIAGANVKEVAKNKPASKDKSATSKHEEG